jgi:hypothetical protein
LDEDNTDDSEEGMLVEVDDEEEEEGEGIVPYK